MDVNYIEIVIRNTFKQMKYFSKYILQLLMALNYKYLIVNHIHIKLIHNKLYLLTIVIILISNTKLSIQHHGMSIINIKC